jgi:hypothetical protein
MQQTEYRKKWLALYDIQHMRARLTRGTDTQNLIRNFYCLI